ncbi:hypothetical protein AGABI1DRAFT_115685 [Agaricus bisporus var. burnettii JB137-S8]|uniref:SH3 domain-containing protein n=1 Tax=Agaricus bisporus var. burnettii (strain JB137-S8 / ATCC MYA-4627 / FGSC 10392) TaxID=597362 RepID=K5WMR9_AGABU|nr:uncharacterized protein AGABI1DRAFT_115685 [Agaricus bisporus var. burnettii JB137-S8]EKM76576.1 hypothetical protein AGABI1DRAFT_115685 [Agaricus bisporus var. burnettii JB137-S8]
MTSQLGRLRQWAGEVMSSKDSKITISDEIKELEEEVEKRKEGILKLQMASEAYHRSLSKKKQYEFVDKSEKLVSLDALGVVMIADGEKFGENSTFGSSLVKYGRAHCKIATLQEAYAVTLKDTFITSLQRFEESIKEYELLKKKLESRRSAYEAAFLKMEKLKQSKKEKEKIDAEEELDRTKQRFEETAEDIRAHMEHVRSADAHHQRELSGFLDIEMNFAQQYLDVLRDVKSDWSQDHTPISPLKRNRAKSLSHRSSGSLKSSSDSHHNGSQDSSDESSSRRSHSSSRHGSKPASRSASRLSRKRTNSNATATGEKDTDPLERAPTPRRRSVAGWASSAVETVTNRKKKDTENFASLEDDDDTDTGVTKRNSSLKKSMSIGSLGRRSSTKSPKVPQQARPRSSSLYGKKLVRARLDYEAKSSNELSFKAGAEIFPLNEVLDSWWMGDLNGRRGLFLMTYVEEIDPSSASRKPKGQADNESIQDSDTQSTDDGYGTSELDEENDLLSRPIQHSPFIAGLDDNNSIISQNTDDEFRPVTIHTPKANPQAVNPPISQTRYRNTPSPPSSLSGSETGILADAGYFGRDTLTPSMQTRSPAGISTKKVPPPPPPRRPNMNTPPIAPPLPQRKTNAATRSSKNARPSSAGSSISSLLTGGGSGSGSSTGGFDRSPFESTQDLTTSAQPLPRSNDKSDGFNPFRS